MRVEEAKEVYLRSAALLEKLAGGHPDVPEYQALLAGTYHNIALLIQNNRESDEELAGAAEHLEKSLAMR